ncbi:Microcystin-dependent protein [Arachidicoccus rhizosphaerae]|uniref:Microcystin-dependent protein n=1 Tax=Arachidicoccus rhizosphaerae TaxID=551991 RepID=A0A1H3XQQ0_9BACT|nr:tail fiber protein [Arachidicoccus rhizosphaerae]SEA00892.1 Microcystin-dependent protein [Arachidicoccus rhizosphaerae]
MEEYLGVIKIFAGNFAPRGWAFCNGQLLSIASNTALFSLLGTVYGGDGITTFALPDLRSRVPVHAGASAGPGLQPYNLGQAIGTETTTLLTSNLPPHTHPVMASMSVDKGNASVPAASQNSTLAAPGYQNGRTFEATLGYSASEPNTQIGGLAVSVGITGSGIPINNIQPSLGVNYIICLAGVYPTRD